MAPEPQEKILQGCCSRHCHLSPLLTWAQSEPSPSLADGEQSWLCPGHLSIKFCWDLDSCSLGASQLIFCLHCSASYPESLHPKYFTPQRIPVWRVLELPTLQGFPALGYPAPCRLQAGWGSRGESSTFPSGFAQRHSHFTGRGCSLSNKWFLQSPSCALPEVLGSCAKLGSPGD